jgi:muramidase (phage lysozyme)
MVGGKVAMNVAAFLSMIGACEGADYDTLFGGQPFVSFDDHPRKSITAGGYTSTAAGRYQILAGTWDDFTRANGVRHFDQAGQDACAVWLIARRGALEDVQAGRLDAAIAKCNKEWASLPGSPYGQRTRSMQFCLDHYLSAGGTLGDEQAAAPIDDQGTDMPQQDSNPFSGLLDLAGPIASIFNPLAGALISAFTPLAKEKLTKEINRHTDNPAIGAQVADGVIAAAQKVTNLLDPVDAVAAARKDPALMAQIEADALSRLQALQPLLDKVAEYDSTAWAAEEASRSAAAMRASQGGQVPFWSDRVFIVSLLVLLMVAALGVSVVFMPAWTQDNRTQLLQAFLSALAGVLGFWIGSTRSSSAKDVTISEMARNK